MICREKPAIMLCAEAICRELIVGFCYLEVIMIVGTIAVLSLLSVNLNNEVVAIEKKTVQSLESVRGELAAKGIEIEDGEREDGSWT